MWNADGVEPRARAVEGVERGLVSLALAWQALWLVADPRFWPTSQEHAATLVAVLASVAAWALLLAAHLRRDRRLGAGARWLDLAALFAVSVGLLWAASGTSEPDWAGPASWALLPAGLAGLLFPWRVAACWVTAVVLVETAFVFGILGPGDPLHSPQDVLYPGYALSVGVMTIAARHVLLRDARRADAAADHAAEAAHQRRTAQGVSASVHREARVLHETVLNTLAAIIRGRSASTPEMADALRARCRESAAVLQALQSHVDPGQGPDHSGRLEADLRVELDDLRSRGAVVHVDCQPLPVPDHVYERLVTASREALANVARHAGAQAVWLTTHVTVSSGATSVEVEVRDDGGGFDPTAPSDRFGLREAIVMPLAEVHGRAVIESAPLTGTRIVMSWPDDVAARTDGALSSTAAFTIPVLASFGAYAAAQFIIGWDEFTVPAMNAAAFAIVAGLALLLGLASLRGPFTWVVLLVVAGACPVVYQLQTQALGAEATEGWVAWSSGAIVALFVVLAAGGPAWGWLALLGTWLLIQGDIVSELLAPGTALVLAAALFGHAIRANAVRVDLNRFIEAEERSAEHEAQDSVGRLRRRYGALQQSHAVDLLTGVADGRRDPASPTVRSDAALEERFIRTVLRVDPTLDAVHALASSLAVEARHAGVFLDVDISGDVRVGDLADVSQSLTRALACSQPGGVARFTARREGTQDVVRLVAPIWPSGREAMARLPVRGVVLDPGDPSDPDMLWEVRTEARPADAAAELVRAAP